MIYILIALVAQLVAHQTSNLGVAGSIPAKSDFFIILAFNNCYKNNFIFHGTGNLSSKTPNAFLFLLFLR